MKPELLPSLSKVPGFIGSYLLRKSSGDEFEFVAITLWDSIESIRAIGGKNYEMGVIPEEWLAHLSHYDPRAEHYEVASIQGLAKLSK